MGVVIDMVAGPPSHILTVRQVEHAEQDTRDGENGKEKNLAPRIEKDGGEKYGRYGSRSPDRNKSGVVAIFE